MIIELREYVTQPGRRQEWVDFMRDTIVPFQISCGMEILGQFTVQDHPDGFVWMRRFDDEEHYQRLRTAVYDSAVWKDDIAPRVRELLVPGRARVRFLDPACGAAIDTDSLHPVTR